MDYRGPPGCRRRLLGAHLRTVGGAPRDDGVDRARCRIRRLAVTMQRLQKARQAASACEELAARAAPIRRESRAAWQVPPVPDAMGARERLGLVHRLVGVGQDVGFFGAAEAFHHDAQTQQGSIWPAPSARLSSGPQRV